MIVPVSLLAHITLTRATSPGSRASASRSAVGETRPTASTGSHSTRAPSWSASQCTVSSTAWCSTGLTSTRRRAGLGGPARPVQALDGQVVRLGATRGQHHLARARAEGGGERLAALLDGAAGPPSGGVQRGGVAGDAELFAHHPHRGGVHGRGGGVIEVGGVGHGDRVYEHRGLTGPGPRHSRISRRSPRRTSSGASRGHR